MVTIYIQIIFKLNFQVAKKRLKIHLIFYSAEVREHCFPTEASDD